MQKPIPFLKYTPLYFTISLLVILPGLFSLVTNGLKPAIDFTGGSLVELSADKPLTSEVINNNKPTNVEVVSSQTSGNDIIIRTKPITKDDLEALKASLVKAGYKVVENRFETVGPTLGKELLTKTVGGLILAAVLIMLYVGYRFKQILYGLSAVLAMFHDSLVILGVFSILGKVLGVEVDTLFVTALLTILSFSVHDTIVVYDRIRESIKFHPKADLKDLAEKAINETLPRSINNSMTIIFMLLTLWLMGGETTKWFAFTLLIGTITGTYSSTFTAIPLLVTLNKRFSK